MLAKSLLILLTFSQVNVTNNDLYVYIILDSAFEVVHLFIVFFLINISQNKLYIYNIIYYK